MGGRGWVVVVGLVACVCASERVEAAPPMRRSAELAPQAFPRQMGVFGTQYGGRAPIAFVTEVDNPLSTPINGVQVTFLWTPQPQNPSVSVQPPAGWPTQTAEKTVTLRPGANEVTFVPSAILPICGFAYINVLLGPPGTPGLDTNTRLTTVQASSCSYSGTFNNPWDTMEPDRVVAQKVGVAWVNNVVMTAPPACGSNTWTQLRFDFVNATTGSGQVLVHMTDPNGDVVGSQAVTINAPKGGNSVTSAVVNVQRPSVTGPLKIQFMNVEGQKPITVANPGLTFDLEGTCTIGIQPQILVVSH
jgi:hypothetical protein